MRRSERMISAAATIFAWIVAAMVGVAIAALAVDYRPRPSLTQAPTWEPRRLIAARFEELYGGLGGYGLQGVVFGDGSGYVLEVDTYEPDGRPALSRVTPFQVSADKLAGLIGVFRANGFFQLDEHMLADAYDGRTVTLAYAERGARHTSANHEVDHPQFNAIDAHFKALLERKRGAKAALTTSGLLEQAIDHLNALPPASEERAVIGALYDDWLRDRGMHPALSAGQLAAWEAVRQGR